MTCFIMKPLTSESIEYSVDIGEVSFASVIDKKKRICFKDVLELS